ncbi:MAG: cytochrome P460 family protein [Bryobacterales bacterium]|nr:cytochrome P460 family protein [Bryobacterales bacterium]
MRIVRCASLAVVCLGAIITSQGQAPPAPTVDRVGFPQDYASWQKLYVFDRPDTRQVRTIYANEKALEANSDNQFNYPYGSVLVMETWRALQTPAAPTLDAEGRYQKDPAAAPTLFVMRKERGFGEAYGPNRNGEWEYMSYRPDGSVATAPQNTASCAICHLQAGQSKDYVMRAGLKFSGASGAVPDAVIQNYRFIPGELRVKAGSVVTFYNDDVTEHTITDIAPNGGDTGRIRAGASVGIKFDTPMEFEFRCTIHPAMRGKVIVEP